MAKPETPRSRPESPSRKPDIDLKGFDATTVSDGIINGARNLPEGLDIKTHTINALTALPFSAKWPVFNELYSRNMAASENPEQDPVEAAVSSSVESLYFPHDIERTLEELNLRDEIERSGKNYIYFSDFQEMTWRAKEGLALTAVYDKEWQRVQQGKPEVAQEENVTENWIRLRAELAAERNFRENAWQAARPARAERPLLPNQDARRVGADLLSEQSATYSRIRETHSDEMEQKISTIKNLVATVSETDPIQTAQILWNTVLSDDEKAVISRERSRFRKADRIVAEASYFTDSDHRDPVYQAFRDHEAATVDRLTRGWPTQMVALERSFGPIEKQLIGDYKRILSETEEVAKPRDPLKGIADLEHKKSDPLQRYVVDVSLAFLKTDIAA